MKFLVACDMTHTSLNYVANHFKLITRARWRRWVVKEMSHWRFVALCYN